MKEQMIHPKQFYFSETFKRGSINAAADHLNRMQASIDCQIQLLEQELGVRLFECGMNGRRIVPSGQGRATVPTEAAQIVYDFYRQCCDCQDKMEAALQELCQMNRGNISIAMPPTFIDAFIQNVLNGFYREYPSSTSRVKGSTAALK